MILNKERKRRTAKKLIKFVLIMVGIVVLFLGIHACGVRYFNQRVTDVRDLAEDFKQNAKEFAPTKEETVEATKNGFEKFVDFIFKGSKYIDENITQPAFEYSTELGKEAFKSDKTEEATETSVGTLEKVTYWKTVDGDTIKILNSEDEFITVRLIGINTPESVASEEYLSQKGTVNSDYGKEASNHTEELIENAIFKNLTDIYLQYDVQLTDDYGRVLAYVWLKGDVDVESESDVENYMLNARILSDGYAEDVVYEPNHKYASLFKRLRTEAEQKQEGLWGYIDIYEYY